MSNGQLDEHVPEFVQNGGGNEVPGELCEAGNELIASIVGSQLRAVEELLQQLHSSGLLHFVQNPNGITDLGICEESHVVALNNISLKHLYSSCIVQLDFLQVDKVVNCNHMRINVSKKKTGKQYLESRLLQKFMRWKFDFISIFTETTSCLRTSRKLLRISFPVIFGVVCFAGLEVLGAFAAGSSLICMAAESINGMNDWLYRSKTTTRRFVYA